jgi:hypothetical protein
VGLPKGPPGVCCTLRQENYDKHHFSRAAEFSGGSWRIPLPEPALITNPYPNSAQLHGYNQGFVINAG